MFEMHNLTDFERLLFTVNYVKELKADIKRLNIKNGMLRSEIDELRYALKHQNPSASKLHSYKQQMKNTRINNQKLQLMYDKLLVEFTTLKNENQCKQQNVDNF